MKESRRSELARQTQKADHADMKSFWEFLKHEKIDGIEAKGLSVISQVEGIPRRWK